MVNSITRITLDQCILKAAYIKSRYNIINKLRSCRGHIESPGSKLHYFDVNFDIILTSACYQDRNEREMID